MQTFIGGSSHPHRASARFEAVVGPVDRNTINTDDRDRLSPQGSDLRDRINTLRANLQAAYRMSGPHTAPAAAIADAM
jgi:hypothetical protein